MIVKMIGAICIIASCGYLGLSIAASHRRSTKMMQQLLSAIEYIADELRYRASSLPEIFHQTAVYSGGEIGEFFSYLAEELERQIAPNIPFCVDAALSKVKDMPELVKNGIRLLGKTLGHFDLDGQLNGLEAVHGECSSMLKAVTDNQDIRLRSYQTLALCAGAAIAILFV